MIKRLHAKKKPLKSTRANSTNSNTNNEVSTTYRWSTCTLQIKYGKVISRLRSLVEWLYLNTSWANWRGRAVSTTPGHFQIVFYVLSYKIDNLLSQWQKEMNLPRFLSVPTKKETETNNKDLATHFKLEWTKMFFKKYQSYLLAWSSLEKIKNKQTKLSKLLCLLSRSCHQGTFFAK